MPKHTIQNLAVAIIVPTILFAIALLGTRHINMPQAAVGSKFSQDSVTYLQQILEANVALKPYLKFDSVQNVCDSAVTAYHKRKGHVYYVELDRLFPESPLKGLRAYIADTYMMGDNEFYCDGGPLEESWLIKNSSGEYSLVFKSNFKEILLGHASFDLRDDLWHNLADYGRLTNATIILLVSLMIIFLSYFLYHSQSELKEWLYVIAILLGGVWLYGYNGSCGEDKFYDFKNIILLYITLCWLCSIIALFIPLEERSILFVKEQKKKNNLLNGVDINNILGIWLEAHNEGTLIFNKNRTAYYLDKDDIHTAYKFSLNSDGLTGILFKEDEKHIFGYFEYPELNNWELNFLDKTFTRDGNSIEEQKEEINKATLLDSILGKQSRHSGGNTIISILIILLSMWSLLIEASSVAELLVNFLFLGFGLIIWGAIRLYHKYLSSKRKKLIVICNKVYGKLSNEKMPDYLRYCLKHGEISIEEYSKLDEGKDS